LIFIILLLLIFSILYGLGIPLIRMVALHTIGLQNYAFLADIPNI